MRYIGAIDQGTTSTRFILFSEEGEIVAWDQKEHRQQFPQPGWVEHDVEEIWANTVTVMRNTMRKCSVQPSQVAAIGITNQRETVVPFDPSTGEVYHNAIVWQDLRTSSIVSRLKKEMDEDDLRRRTGLLFSPYFAASKMMWLLENVDGLRARMDEGRLAFATIDS